MVRPAVPSLVRSADVQDHDPTELVPRVRRRQRRFCRVQCVDVLHRDLSRLRTGLHSQPVRAYLGPTHIRTARVSSVCRASRGD
ncbi:hypothetical protein ACFPRL_24250 [Pseudoclavibacter helvolus]